MMDKLLTLLTNGLKAAWKNIYIGIYFHVEGGRRSNHQLQKGIKTCAIWASKLKLNWNMHVVMYLDQDDS